MSWSPRCIFYLWRYTYRTGLPVPYSRLARDPKVRDDRGRELTLSPLVPLGDDPTTDDPRYVRETRAVYWGMFKDMVVSRTRPERRTNR
ncbi:hypothetical protein J6590_103393 [Homalodisca vitripennis]|nr:hypothetical protein J6590_103393 [Homalodisca vitripennis]